MYGVHIFPEIPSPSGSVQTILFPEKKGGITEVAVGDFDKDNYDENELEQYVKDSIKEYEDNDGAGTVKLKNLSVKDGVAKLGMHYSDSTAYSAFVGDTVFTGTVVQAIAAGYDFLILLSRLHHCLHIL